ncbi:MAG: hypothetical protein WCT28_02435 [Patescibacteria group bacterium]|jgi:hypothetical protein
MKTDEFILLQDVLLYIAIGIVGFVLAVVALVCIRRALRRWRFGAERENVVKHWQAVETLVQRGDETSYRLALIQADSVLDLALRVKAFPGTTTGERLKFASRKYPELRKTFWARSLRNRIVHESGSELKIKEAKSAISALRQALVVLGAL